MRIRTILLGVGVVGLLSQCGPPAGTGGATPPPGTALAGGEQAATAAPSPTIATPSPTMVTATPPPVLPTVTPSPTATAPMTPILAAALPTDRAWILGPVEPNGLLRLLAIAPGEPPLLFPAPVQSMLPRPGSSPLVSVDDTTALTLADPATGWTQEIAEIDADARMSGVADAADEAVLLVAHNGLDAAHPGLTLLRVDRQGSIAQTAISGVDPWLWDFPEIVIWDGQDAYVSTHSSAPRYVWHVRLDEQERVPERVITLGHGGPIWITPDNRRLIHHERTGSSHLVAFDRASGSVTPFAGDPAALRPTENVFPPYVLPGFADRFAVVFTP